jgi:hypothetical protein
MKSIKFHFQNNEITTNGEDFIRGGNDTLETMYEAISSCLKNFEIYSIIIHIDKYLVDKESIEVLIGDEDVLEALISECGKENVII